MPLSAADRLAISEVIARYCHATDAGDGNGVADQFTDDGILEITGAWQARGREQIKQIGDFPNKPKHWINSIVIDGTGSTAESTVYYAAIRGSGPLLATGRYESKLTKQFNGQWRLVHHRYTGDPFEGGGQRPPQRDNDMLTAEDRIAIIELVGRLNHALQGQHDQTASSLFTDNCSYLHGSDSPAEGPEAVTRLISNMNTQGSRYWCTNFIIEGTSRQATLRAYVARVEGDAVVATGIYDDTLIKVNETWKIDKHHFIPDPAPQ